MAYSDKEKTDIVDAICKRISEGTSLTQAVIDLKTIPKKTFFTWIDVDEVKRNQYTRATSERADAIFEQTLTIADKQDKDVYTDGEGNKKTDHNVLGRSRLQVDTRKWMAGKLNPKKYGEASLLKIGDPDGEPLKINALFTQDLLNTPKEEGEKE